MVKVDIYSWTLKDLLKKDYEYNDKEAECLVEWIDECCSDFDDGFPVEVHMENADFRVLAPNEDFQDFKAEYDEKTEFTTYTASNGYKYIEALY